MEMHQVRYFLALCDELHFTRAARRCGVTQPSLTRAIKMLEKELGGALFERERGNIRLSELGRAIVPFFENIRWCEQSAKCKAADFNSSQSRRNGEEHEARALTLNSPVAQDNNEDTVGLLQTLAERNRSLSNGDATA